MSDQTSYFVLYPDETRGYGAGPSSYIPTYGSATTAVDLYRTVGVASTTLPQLGAAFTDIYAVAAVSRVAEGGISDIAELEAAETALQALLLHDVVHVLVPSPKIQIDQGIITYLRQDQDRRTQFGFDLFALAGSRDWLVAPKFVRTQDGTVASSTLPNSALVGASVEDVRLRTRYWNEDVTEALNVTIESHGVPAYLTDPTMVRSRRGDGFPKRFYHSLRKSWDQAVGDIPPIVCTFALPPLLAVVLNRLNNRADLQTVIADLRSELAPVRAELQDFNRIVTQSTSQAEIDARVRRIVESFDSIVPESRLSTVQRRQRKILTIQGLVRPLVKFAMGFAMKSGATVEAGISAAHGVSDAVIESRSIVDRTVTAQTFVGLMRTESLQALVGTHFTAAEVAALERTIRRRDSKA
jgi:hypothetical protein